jgi:hypothetical protein
MCDAAPYCSICGGDVEPWPGGKDYGCNAQPVNDGRCCHGCNDSIVIPRRIRDFERRAEKPSTTQ